MEWIVVAAVAIFAGAIGYSIYLMDHHRKPSV